MEFRKRVEITKPDFFIDHHSRIALLGSCFAENIGNKLQDNKFNVHVNPFGILYNPSSIAAALHRLVTGTPFSENELRENNGLFVSMMHHGSFSRQTKEEALKAINNSLQTASVGLKEADILILTFGTAYIYMLKESGTIVSNCHKFPASMFDRKKLSVASITDSWRSTIEELREINPSLKILFTVSPVRHWKDGAHNNQLSKAALLLAIDELIHSFEGIYYFPSYEIMMDELRDYRFYAEDMIHPANAAIDYIWEVFSDTYFDEKTRQINKEWGIIHRAVGHRPFNPGTEEHKQFLRQTLLKVNELRKKYPYFELEKEIEQLTQRLS